MDIFGGNDINGILNTGLNVLNTQVGIIILDDLPKRDTFSDQFEDVLDRNSSASDTGFPEVNIGVD